MADEVQRRMLELIFQRDFSPIYAIAPLLRTRHVNFVDQGLALFAWHELACVSDYFKKSCDCMNN